MGVIVAAAVAVVAVVIKGYEAVSAADYLE